MDSFCTHFLCLVYMNARRLYATREFLFYDLQNYALCKNAIDKRILATVNKVARSGGGEKSSRYVGF